MQTQQKKVEKVVGRAVPVPGDDIDTDRIIPARFMKCVTFEGLGQYAFYSERFDDDGYTLNHPLDAAEHEGASILISGRNFGCGSSREHAPQALHRFGINAIIAVSFAEIFFGNCTKLGVPCVSVTNEQKNALIEWARENPDKSMEIDLHESVVRAGDDTYPFDMPDGARESLIEGKWDPLQQLMSNADAIEETAASLPYIEWSRQG
jgi:3-isopropylmalate/(R)-2-methylmalate dehydratase small subunit